MAIHFAYGSNMSFAQMTERCPDAVALGRGWLPDYAFTIGERGYATLVPAPGAFTWGVLWELTERCEQTLDRREGVKIGCYRCEHLVVGANGGVPVEALVYIDDLAGPGTPNPGYMAKVVTGALEFGLAPDYIRRLVDWDHETAELLPELFVWFLTLPEGGSVSGDTAADALVALGIQWWEERLTAAEVRERISDGGDDGALPDEMFLQVLSDTGLVTILPDWAPIPDSPEECAAFADSVRRHPSRCRRGRASRLSASLSVRWTPATPAPKLW